MGLSLPAIDGKYEIVAKLKEGGMGAIYKVRHRLLDEIRIVKVLRPQFEDDVELKERFAREARAAIKLRHPNVVQIFDFSVDESGGGLIVMEFIQGIDLNQLIATGHLPSLALALEISRQSLRALGFLHQHGFVHRDVSPDNLMLTHDVDNRPLIKLIDLGIAKRHDTAEQLTVGGSFLGKFRYASPEHFGSRGPHGVEARSDLYTFGLVFYELLTGTYPILANGTSQLIAGHLFQPPIGFASSDPSGRLPESLRRMVLRSLAKNPDERYQDAAGWIAEIEAHQQEYRLTAKEVAEARRLSEKSQEALMVKPPPPPGSTQHQLDRSFGLEATPRPGSVQSGPIQVLPPRNDADEATHISRVSQINAAAEVEPRQALLIAVRGVIAQAEMSIDAGNDQEAIAVLRRAQQMVGVSDPHQQELAEAVLRLAKKVQSRPSQPVELPPILTSDDAAREMIAEAARQLDLMAASSAPDDEEPKSVGTGLLAALAEIERHRLANRVLPAWKLLKRAIDRFGEVDSLTEMRQELAEQLLEDAHG